MKKYILGLGLVLAATATSCSDSFLDVNAPSQIPTDEYYTTKAHMNELLISAFTPLAWHDWAQGQYNPLNVMSDLMSDDIYPGGATAADNENWHKMFNFSCTPDYVISGIWTNCYNGIRRCNYVHEYMDNITDIDDTTRDLWIAEAKTLRAYYYLTLWKFWGDVPFYTKNLTFPYQCSKSEADVVYEGIIKDLQDAIDMNALPMRNYNTADQNVTGHATLAFAYMIYADAVMYQKDTTRYSTALQYMNNIINSGVYKLTSDYDAIWDEENEWNDEIIFAINYFHNGASRSWSNPYYVGGTVLPTLISPNGLETGTVYRGVAWGQGEGWGFCPVRLDAYEAFEEGDTRRDASINDFRDKTYNARYEDTGLWIRKFGNRVGYNDGQIADAVMNFGQDLPIYRYSETLLNAAELALLGGGSADSQGYLDQVRARAGLGSISATVDNIINERRFEFLGEGKRYFDLVRSGKAASVLGPDPNGYRTNTWSESRKYLPIPQSEINSSDGSLIQNPNY
jgi:hypothetical protein